MRNEQLFQFTKLFSYLCGVVYDGRQHDLVKVFC